MRDPPVKNGGWENGREKEKLLVRPSWFCADIQNKLRDCELVFACESAVVLIDHQQIRRAWPEQRKTICTSRGENGMSSQWALILNFLDQEDQTCRPSSVSCQ